MVLARHRLLLSVLAVALWVVITVGPGLLPHETSGMIDAIARLMSGIVFNTLLAGAVLAGIALALRWTDLGFNRPEPWRSLWLLWLPGLYIALFFGVGVALGLPPFSTLGIILLNTLLVGFSEELAFRGVLFRGLRSRFGMWPSVLISSAAFGAVHVLNVLATGNLLAATVQALAATMTGVLFVALVIRTGSILPAMALHVLWDFGSFLVLSSAVQQAQTAAAGGAEMAEISPLLYVVPLLFNLPNFLYALYLLRPKRTAAVEA